MHILELIYSWHDIIYNIIINPFNAVCWKCAAEKIRNAFMSKIVVCIQKVVFSRSFGKMQIEICFTIIKGLYLYKKKFWSMDVSCSPWCFYSCYYFFKKGLETKKITLGLFETSETTGQALAKSLTKLLDWHFPMMLMGEWASMSRQAYSSEQEGISKHNPCHVIEYSYYIHLPHGYY